MDTWTVDLPDPGATRRLGRLLGERAAAGVIIALIGDLGAGKTALTKAVIAALGGVEEDDVVSPTFVLAQEYPGRIEALHIDAYRLADPAGLTDLGFDLEAGLTLIEWADRVEEALPDDRLTITIEHAAPGRVASFRAGGEGSRRLLEDLSGAAQAAGFRPPEASK